LKAKDPQSKRVLQLTAEQWRALADSADKLHPVLN
jgi:ribosomal protein S15P/S13E